MDGRIEAKKKLNLGRGRKIVWVFVFAWGEVEGSRLHFLVCGPRGALRVEARIFPL